MFPYVTIAVAVLTSVLTFTLKEFAKHFVGKMLNDDKNKKKNENKMQLELKQNVEPVGNKLRRNRLYEDLNKYNKGNMPILKEEKFINVKQEQGSTSITYIITRFYALSSGHSDVRYPVSHKGLPLKTIKNHNESDSDSD